MNAVDLPRCERIIVSTNKQCTNRVKAPGNKLCGSCMRFLTSKSQAPDVRRKYTEVAIEDESRRLLRELIAANEIDIELREFDKDFNPFDALLGIVQEQVQWKDICLAKLAKLKEDEWRWDGDRAGEQLRSEVVIYERAVERATKTLERIARLGIEERLMRIAERQAAIVETAIVRTLQELNLAPDVMAVARQRVVMHLKAS